MKRTILLILVAMLSIFCVNTTAQTYLEIIKDAEQKYKEKDYENSAKLYEQAFETGDATIYDLYYSDKSNKLFPHFLQHIQMVVFYSLNNPILQVILYVLQ